MTTIHTQLDDHTFLQLHWRTDRSLRLSILTPTPDTHGLRWRTVDLGVVRSDVLDRFLSIRPAKEKGGLKVCRATVH